MSAAETVLERARHHGVKVVLDGEQIRLKAPRKPPDELLAELRAHKAELLEILNARGSLFGADGVHYPVCGDPLDGGELIDATDGYSSARIHRRCLEAWSEATAGGSHEPD